MLCNKIMWLLTNIYLLLSRSIQMKLMLVMNWEELGKIMKNSRPKNINNGRTKMTNQMVPNCYMKVLLLAHPCKK